MRMMLGTRSRYDGGQTGFAVATKGRIEAAKSRYATDVLSAKDSLTHLVLQAGRTNPLE